MKENNKFILPLKLQHFAEGGDPPTDPPKDPIDPPVDPPKTFTQADFDREISKMYEKFEEKFNKRAETAKQEAERLANMNAEERLKYEIEQREKAIADKEREWTLKENKYECSKILSEKGLPVAFTDFVVAESAEEMNKNIRIFETEFKKAVLADVDKRIKGNIPKTATVGLTEEMTKEKLAKLPYDQQMAYLKEHPDFL